MRADPRTERTDERIRAEAERIMALGEGSPRFARDPVNMPMIENWVEAIGDDNCVYTDPEFAAASVHGALVAPPAMTQVWTMAGQRAGRDDGDPMSQIVAVLEDAGYTSVVATNADHVFRRYLRLGERLALRVALASLTGPKRTALGEGWFFTTRHTWYSGDEVVATMDFRILKFRPPDRDTVGAMLSLEQQQGAHDAAADSMRQQQGAQDAGTGSVMRPVISPDTRFFWDGMAAGELRIQRCRGCGALRHPPGPMCPACGRAMGSGPTGRPGGEFPGVVPLDRPGGGFRAVVPPGQRGADPGYVVAAGTGSVFSYVVHHHPPVPGKKLPLVIALVELDEGVRIVGEMPGVRPESVSVGMPVRIEFLRVDDELTLPAWLPRQFDSGLEALPGMTVHVTPTFVVASALATRDFTPVHHDRDLAVANGGQDIFLNILTDTGLVQRFVTQWAGPQALVREISIRLGVPCYAGDTLKFSGQVTERRSVPDGDRCAVSVVGRCGLGDHIVASAVVDVPGGRS